MKKNRLIFLLVFILIFPSNLFSASTSFYKLGQFEKGSLKLIYQDVSLSTYKAYGTHYVSVSDLKQLGLNVIYTAADKTILISAPSETLVTTTAPALSLNNTAFSFYNGSIQIGHLKTQALVCEGHTFIPLAALGQLGSISITDDIYTFTPGTEPPIVATQTTLKNFSDSTFEVTLLDIYWKNEAILETSSYILMPNEILSRQPAVQDETAIYVATIIQGAISNEMNYKNNSYLGQLNSTLLQKYERLQNGTFLDDYGDAIDLEKVIWAEDIVNNKKLSSPTPYLVWTNIGEQRTYIFQGSTGDWTLIKTFICSTGRDRTPTPTGTFALTRKVPSFGQNKGYCCKYAFGFIGTSYLYHSIIFDKTGSYLLENKGVLGRKASEGCIRFSVDHAKWFYDNMTSGTTVYIS